MGGYFLSHMLPNSHPFGRLPHPSARRLRLDVANDVLEDDRLRWSLFRYVHVLVETFTDVTLSFDQWKSPSFQTLVSEWMKTAAFVSECIRMMDPVYGSRITYELSLRDFSDVTHIAVLAALIWGCIEPITRWDQTRFIVRVPDGIVAPLESALRAVFNDSNPAWDVLLDQKSVSVDVLE